MRQIPGEQTEPITTDYQNFNRLQQAIEHYIYRRAKNDYQSTINRPLEWWSCDFGRRARGWKNSIS